MPGRSGRGVLDAAGGLVAAMAEEIIKWNMPRKLAWNTIWE